MITYDTQGYYGSGHTPCTVLVCENYSGLKWYCVEGSCTDEIAANEYEFTEGGKLV